MAVLAALVPLVGLAFGALALVVTAMARSYDFFMYYFTLVITPMSSCTFSSCLPTPRPGSMLRACSFAGAC